MKKKNFRLSMAALMGLVCYFLALSALLFGSMGMPGGNGFGAGAGGTSHAHGNSPTPPEAKLGSHGKPHSHGGGFPVAGTNPNQDGRCTSTPAGCGGSNFGQAADGPEGFGGRGAGGSADNGKSDPSGSHDPNYPVPSGFAFFGANSPPGSTGENGGSSQNSGGGKPAGQGNFTGPGPVGDGPDPPNTSPPNEPGFTDPPISQFSINDPPGPGDQDTSTGTPQISSTDPPSDPPDPPISVPEPSTFWMLAGSMAIAVTALRGSRRARPG